MIKISLIALFALSLATLTLAASNMPAPPEVHLTATAGPLA